MSAGDVFGSALDVLGAVFFFALFVLILARILRFFWREGK